MGFLRFQILDNKRTRIERICTNSVILRRHETNALLFQHLTIPQSNGRLSALKCIKKNNYASFLSLGLSKNFSNFNYTVY